MKITILQGAFLPVPPIHGGAVEKIWYLMGREFAALGHEVVHISKSHPNLLNQEKDFDVKYLRVPGYDTPASLFKLKWLDLLYSIRAIKKIPKDVNIIVTNTFWSPFLLRGKKGKKVYVSVERFPKGQMKYYVHVGLLRGCSPIICDAIKKEIPPMLDFLVSYVPNPVPFTIKPMSKNQKNVILFVGRLHPEKGVHVLIEAFSILNKKEGKDWKLVIVGPFDVKAGGGGEAYYQKLLVLSKDNTVEFVGPIYNEKELIEHYAQAKIFCYPAQEGSGDAAPVAPREAMAYGCVPVVSKLACFDDFIIDGINGIRYNQNAPDQAYQLSQMLSLLMVDELTLKRISEEGKKVIKEYSIEAIAKKFVADFKKIYNA